jgi:hypothetical protein
VYTCLPLGQYILIYYTGRIESTDQVRGLCHFNGKKLVEHVDALSDYILKVFATHEENAVLTMQYHVTDMRATIKVLSDQVRELQCAVEALKRL